MTDTQLMVQTGKGWPARRADERDIDLVVVWLREQGAGEEVTLFDAAVFDSKTVELTFIMDRKRGADLFRSGARVLVVPLDTEPPKNKQVKVVANIIRIGWLLKQTPEEVAMLIVEGLER